MLTLSRNMYEKIIITVGNEKIEIMIVEIINTTRVKLGFIASNSVTIDREEIYNSKIITKAVPQKIILSNKHPIVKFNNEK